MLIGRLLLAVTACFTLSSCALINTALRLAPYLMMFADEEPGAAGKVQDRAKQIEQKGHFAPPREAWQPAAESQMAAR